MTFAIQFSGPRTPHQSPPVRLPGSVRRTTSIDVTRDDLYGSTAIVAIGRDLATGPDGSVAARRSARLVGSADEHRALTGLRAGEGSEPSAPAALERLIGASTAAGFRREVAAAMPDELVAGTLWHLLVDDLVGALLVSGVAPQHAEERAGGGPIEEMTREFADQMRATMSDICAGWATDATMLREFGSTGKLPVACGPVAPPLARSDDPDAIHLLPDLVPHAVRRWRRVDVGPVGPGGDAPIDVHFRDSHVDEEGVERCVHEYHVAGSVDLGEGTIRSLAAQALVLPWRECPGSIGSEKNLRGCRFAEVRDRVRSDLRGTSTCTHLNDTLRCLADVGSIARLAVG